jgi:hypothetical protein
VKFVGLSSVYTYEVVNETAYVPRFYIGDFIKGHNKSFLNNKRPGVPLV